MKKYDLEPSRENLLRTYKEDSIGRNADLIHFIAILDAIEDGCSIALDGNWGSGKTFFVKQAKMVPKMTRLRQLRPSERTASHGLLYLGFIFSFLGALFSGYLDNIFLI